jgi:hypothetical protein
VITRGLAKFGSRDRYDDAADVLATCPNVKARKNVPSVAGARQPTAQRPAAAASAQDGAVVAQRASRPSDPASEISTRVIELPLHAVQSDRHPHRAPLKVTS